MYNVAIWALNNSEAIIRTYDNVKARLTKVCRFFGQCSPLNFVCPLNLTDVMNSALTARDEIVNPPAGSPPVACLSISNTTGTAPLFVTFNSSCTTDPDNNIHRMSISVDGITSEQCGRFDEVKNYTTSGPHSVTITVFDTTGASSSHTYNYNVTITGNGDKKVKTDYFNEFVLKPFYDSIEKSTLATADFSYFPTSGSFSVNVNFDASSSSGPYILDYIWNFSDGSPTQQTCWPRLQRSFTHTTGVTLGIVNIEGDTELSAEKFVLVSNGD